MFLLNRYLCDLTSVAGSVCGDLSRPDTPESVSERSSTLIATEIASTDDVSREPEANKLAAEKSEASTRSSTPKPSPASTASSVPTPLPVNPHHTGAENHQRPQPVAGKFLDRAPRNYIKSLPVRPPNNQNIKQSQTRERVETILPYPILVTLPTERSRHDLLKNWTKDSHWPVTLLSCSLGKKSACCRGTVCFFPRALLPPTRLILSYPKTVYFGAAGEYACQMTKRSSTCNIMTPTTRHV